MDTIFYPNKAKIDEAMQSNDLLLMIVSFDISLLIVSIIDDHFPILAKPDYHQEYGTDKYFRFTLSQEEAEWVFICPLGYKGIKNQDERIEQYRKDGLTNISEAIKRIGYNCKINIPARYSNKQ